MNFPEPQINPPDLASIREPASGDIFVNCALSGENLCKLYNIVYADERAGWFVHSRRGPFNEEYLLCQRPIKIDKTLSAPEIRASKYFWEQLSHGVFQSKFL